MLTNNETSAIESFESPESREAPSIKPAVMRVLNNFEILYKTKFTDLVLASWVEVLNPIPDTDLISTGIRVAQTSKYLPTPMEFLEVYREGLRAKREREKAEVRARLLGGDSTPYNRPQTEAEKKEYNIFRLAIALEAGRQEDEQGKKVLWKDFDESRLNADIHEFFESMRSMSLEYLEDLNMQIRMPEKKNAVKQAIRSSVSNLLNRE